MIPGERSEPCSTVAREPTLPGQRGRPRARGNGMDTRRDVEALPQKYQDLHHALSTFVPADRLVTDPLRTLAFGTDASFYRLVPKIVVRVRSTEEVARVLREASRLDLGCTFRAGGTSLSGQAVSDSVLVQVTGGFRRAEVKE